MDSISQITDDASAVFITGDFNALVSDSLFDPILEEFENTRKSALLSDNTKSYNSWGRWYISVLIDFISEESEEGYPFKVVILAQDWSLDGNKNL